MSAGLSLSEAVNSMRDPDSVVEVAKMSLTEMAKVAKEPKVHRERPSPWAEKAFEYGNPETTVTVNGLPLACETVNTETDCKNDDETLSAISNLATGALEAEM